MKYLDDVTCIDQDFRDRGFVKIENISKATEAWNRRTDNG